MTGKLAADAADAPYPVVLVLPGINVGQDCYRWVADDAGPGRLRRRHLRLGRRDLPGRGRHHARSRPRRGAPGDLRQPAERHGRPCAPRRPRRSERRRRRRARGAARPRPGRPRRPLGRRHASPCRARAGSGSPSCARPSAYGAHGGISTALGWPDRLDPPGPVRRPAAHGVRLRRRRRGRQRGPLRRGGLGRPPRPRRADLRRGARPLGRRRLAGAARRAPTTSPPSRSSTRPRPGRSSTPHRPPIPPSRAPRSRRSSSTSSTPTSATTAPRSDASRICSSTSRPRSPPRAGADGPSGRSRTVFKNFWYAVEFSTDVTTKPKKIVCLGQQLVMYRKADGSVACLSDLCVHRGAALSGGDGQGRLPRLPVPRLGVRGRRRRRRRSRRNPAGRSIPKKARVDSYPTTERYGFLWVFLGDLPEAERPPIPEWPEFDAARQVPRGLRRVPLEVQLRADPRERHGHRARAVRARRSLRQPREGRGRRLRDRADPVVLLRRGRRLHPPAPKGSQQAPHATTRRRT